MGNVEKTFESYCFLLEIAVWRFPCSAGFSCKKTPRGRSVFVFLRKLLLLGEDESEDDDENDADRDRDEAFDFLGFDLFVDGLEFLFESFFFEDRGLFFFVVVGEGDHVLDFRLELADALLEHKNNFVFVFEHLVFFFDHQVEFVEFLVDRREIATPLPRAEFCRAGGNAFGRAVVFLAECVEIVLDFEDFFFGEEDFVGDFFVGEFARFDVAVDGSRRNTQSLCGFFSRDGVGFHHFA